MISKLKKSWGRRSSKLHLRDSFSKFDTEAPTLVMEKEVDHAEPLENTALLRAGNLKDDLPEQEGTLTRLVLASQLEE